jgi:hypothetical protein
VSAATIQPLPGGKALFVWRGVEHVFDSWQAASREADERGIAWRLERFPATPVPAEVLATT